MLEYHNIYLIEYTDSKGASGVKIVTTNSDFFKYYFQIKLGKEPSTKKSTPKPNISSTIQLFDSNKQTGKFQFRSLSNSSIEVLDKFEIPINQVKIDNFITKFDEFEGSGDAEEIFELMQKQFKMKVNKPKGKISSNKIETKIIIDNFSDDFSLC